MYGWIWRHLPGPRWFRVVLMAVAALVIVFVLFQWVFPWLSPLLPFNNGGSIGHG